MNKQPTTIENADYGHATRLAREHFEIRGHELYVGGMSVHELDRLHGTPLFVYDRNTILARIRRIRAMLPSRFHLFYSIKANPNASILRCFVDAGCGLEVASEGELFQALHAGCPPERVIFAGPGKTRDELAAALRADIAEIHIESLAEAQCLSDLASKLARPARVALRINPVAAAGGAMRMGGRASPFGIDEEELDDVLAALATLPNIEVQGVHIYMGTQILEVDTLLAQYRVALDIARRVALALGCPLKTIDFGGGWGTPYFAHESPLDLIALRDGLADIAAEMKREPLLARTCAILEPGRFLVSEAGIYLATVTRVKESRGRTFVITDGGMHHHLAASGNLGQTIKRNYPVALANKMRRTPTVEADIVGPLCTPLDVLARGIALPSPEAGDIVAVFQSGAYARTASPHGFLSHNSPAEVLVDRGVSHLIRRRGQPADYLRDQPELSPHAIAVLGNYS